MSVIRIGEKLVGSGYPALVFVEVGQNHEGSLGMAHAFVDAVADAGADGIKFQTHIADAESTLDEPFRVKFSEQDETRYDYWKRMEFSADQWAGLAQHAKEKGLVFLSSAFSVEAVGLLQTIGMPVWKIGSGEYKSQDLLQEMMKTGRPILMSTGMSSWDEIDQAAEHFNDKEYPFALFQCTSKYPTPFSDVGLNVFEEMMGRYDVPVGLSDHSGSVYPSMIALARGASLIEVHATFDKRSFGPDVIASITFKELEMLCSYKKALDEMNAHPVDKDNMANNDLAAMREIFTKSYATKTDLEVGTIVSAEMLLLKKPGTGISADQIDNIVGRRLKRSVFKNKLLRLDDFEDE